jgi:antitoxin ParD1/3/4
VPTRNVSLTKEQDALVEKMIKSGEYQNASEAFRDALRALQQRRKEDALKLRALRAQIDAGIVALERGEFDEINETDLKGYLEKLGTRSRKTAP